MADSRIKSARELLSAYFDDEKLRRGGRYAEFFAGWKLLVGEQLASHSWVAEVDRNVVYVEAEHPGWIQLLQLRQSAILEGLALRFPELGLRSISFRLGSARGGALASKEAAPRDDRALTRAWEEEGSPAPPPGPESAASARPPQGSRTLEDIGDPELRGLLSALRDSLRGKP